MPTQSNIDEASAAKARLRRDLTVAIRARDSLRIRVLRRLIAAVDNAEAAPVGDRHDRYASVPFGEKGAEVPRLTLTRAEVFALFASEATALRSVVAELTALGRTDAANVLAVEAEVVDEYSG
jgi:uncharacterized protein YqeY